MRSGLINFDQFGQDILPYDENSECVYGNVGRKNAVPLWRLYEQVYDVQERLYVYSKFGIPNKYPDIQELHRAVKKLLIDPLRLRK